MDVNNDEEVGVVMVKAVALLAASMSWSGISAIKNREKSVLETAEIFKDWLYNDSA